MRLGVLQWHVAKNDKEKNLASIERLTDQGSADLIIMPELFSTGYFFETAAEVDALAEEIPSGYTTQTLVKIAKKQQCFFIGAIMEKDLGCYYITAVIVGPQGYVGKQRKRHLTTDERKIFSSGSQWDVYSLNGCKTGAMICLEGWFPESARELMLKGAQIIGHTALTTQQRTLDIVRVRAIENKAYIAFANSLATELYQGKAITFRGDSRVIDWNGNILIDAGKEEGLFAVAIDESQTLQKDLEDCEDLKEEVMKHWGAQ